MGMMRFHKRFKNGGVAPFDFEINSSVFMRFAKSVAGHFECRIILK